MAAQQPSIQTYSVKDFNLLRVISINKDTITKVFHFVFLNGSSSRPAHMPLLDYYKANGVTAFTKGLYEDQRKKIIADPQGISFDITLLYRCLRNGSHGLANKDDDKWNQGDKSSLESLLTLLKNKRNALSHEHPEYTNEELLAEVHELRNCMIQILQFSGRIYNLPSTIIDQKIADVESSINKYLYEDIEPKTFVQYKQQLFFEAQSEFVNDEGVKDMLEQYDKNMEFKVTTVNHLADHRLPLDDVYTEMKLMGTSVPGQQHKTAYEEVLRGKKQNKTNRVIVVSGAAGVGKTTFTKKIMYDWRWKRRRMEHLDEHDHLLKGECRNTTVRSFEDMLDNLMPKTSKNFKPGDLKKVILAQNVLVILDGLDELNEASADLFKDILYLKKSHGITVLITTRPEKLTYVAQKLRSHRMEMKHIQLQGVPEEKRDELVIKYYRELTKKSSSVQDIGGLLDYLKITEYRLADLWQLPFNLILLTTLWAYGHMNIACINTAPELYKEILKLCRNKLKDRLLATLDLDESKINKKIDFFLCLLGRESLIGLMNDHITLQQDSYQRLEEICLCIEVSVAEMLSAFLKCIPGSKCTYAYPHKGLQDYLAAHYIWLRITENHWCCDAEGKMKIVTEILCHKSYHPLAIEKIANVLEREMKIATYNGNLSQFFSTALCHLLPYLKASNIIHNILENINSSPNYDLPKFQNMLICLLGMFYSETKTIDGKTKLEALKLLQETGVRDRDAWITVLNSVKCDDYVAAFISQQPGILTGEIEISDSSVSAYISLLKALKPPLQNAQNLSVNIIIKGDLTGVYDLLPLLSFYHITVKGILVNKIIVEEYSQMMKTLRRLNICRNDLGIDVVINEDLHSAEGIMKQIKINNFEIRTLRMKDSEINDSNVGKYISLFRSLPRLRKGSVQTKVDLNIKKDLTGADDLLELINFYQFKVRQFLVNEMNFAKYEKMLKVLDIPFKDASDVEMEVCVNKDIATISDLVKEISRIKVSVTMFRVKDFYIDDLNVSSYISLLKSLPPLQKDANETGVEIQIKEDPEDINELLQLLRTHNFRVKGLTMTSQNHRAYSLALRSFPILFPNAPDVNIGIRIDDALLQIKDLLKQIKYQELQISKLEMSKDTTITDSSVNEYTNVMRSLPQFAANSCWGKFNVISYQNTDVSRLLKEISRNCFNVDKCYLFLKFRHPWALTTASASALSNIFQRCYVEEYWGPMSPQFQIPATVRKLRVSVPDTPSYLQLRNFLDTNLVGDGYRLEALAMCVSLSIDRQELHPIPKYVDNLPDLFLPDIATKEDVFKAAEIAHLLKPTRGRRSFGYIFFPRCEVGTKGIDLLLRQMKDVRTNAALLFPSSCRPSSRDVESHLQRIAKARTQCSLGILWGKLPEWVDQAIVNMDSW